MRRIFILMFILSTITFAVPKMELNVGLATRHIKYNEFFNNNNNLLGLEVYVKDNLSIQYSKMDNSFFCETNTLTLNYYRRNWFGGIGVSKGYKKEETLYHDNEWLEVKTPCVSDDGIGFIAIVGYKKKLSENTSLKTLVLWEAITVILSVDLN